MSVSLVGKYSPLPFGLTLSPRVKSLGFQYRPSNEQSGLSEALNPTQSGSAPFLLPAFYATLECPSVLWVERSPVIPSVRR